MKGANKFVEIFESDEFIICYEGWNVASKNV